MRLRVCLYWAIWLLGMAYTGFIVTSVLLQVPTWADLSGLETSRWVARVFLDLLEYWAAPVALLSALAWLVKNWNLLTIVAPPDDGPHGDEVAPVVTPVAEPVPTPENVINLIHNGSDDKVVAFRPVRRSSSR